MKLKYKILTINIKKVLAFIVLIFLLCSNAVDAMERTPQQKMDSDLLREMSEASFDLRLRAYYEGLTQQQQLELINRVSNYAETMVDNVNDNELNLPRQGVQRYESVILFIVASIFGYILIRHGDMLWNFL